jgi:hypothetical protein
MRDAIECNEIMMKENEQRRKNTAGRPHFDRFRRASAMTKNGREPPLVSLDVPLQWLALLFAIGLRPEQKGQKIHCHLRGGGLLKFYARAALVF